MSRVDSVEIAVRKAGARAAGSVMASDAFFPFPDSIDKAAAAGVAAVIQPGGSKNDAAGGGRLQPPRHPHDFHRPPAFQTLESGKGPKYRLFSPSGRMGLAVFVERTRIEIE